MNIIDFTLSQFVGVTFNPSSSKLKETKGKQKKSHIDSTPYLDELNYSNLTKSSSSSIQSFLERNRNFSYDHEIKIGESGSWHQR
jgi:hypothetical protein